MAKQNEVNNEFEEWAKSGLEFEYKVEKKFNDNNWKVHYEYDYDVLREIPEMGKGREEFVERSVDFSPVKTNTYSLRGNNYSIFHQALVESKYSKGKFCFLKSNNLLKDNTNNMVIFRDDSTNIQSFMKISRKLLPNSPLLNKGAVVGDKNDNKIKNAINQLLFASTHFYSYLFFNSYPEGNQSNFNQLIFIHPIFVTNAKIYIRNDTVFDKNKKDFELYFFKEDFGTILIPNKIRFKLYKKYIFDKYFDNSDFNFIKKNKEVINDLNKLFTPTRIFIVNINYLTEFLELLSNTFSEQAKIFFSRPPVQQLNKD